MIGFVCGACKDTMHDQCIERQRETAVQGDSKLCDCQHRENAQTVARENPQ